MKKFLSLVLALVMTMSLVTVSAGAVDFTDDSDIDYKEAVDVISELGIVDGYSDDSFRPDGSLTRGAAAKIICNLILGPTTASALSASTAPFRDVPTTNTFAGYITYCSQQGIISGYGDGTFRPSGTLTGNAFMKMLLGALGYDSDIEGYSGSNWQVNVIKQAAGIGLDDGNDDFVGSQAVTRQEAALYAFNMLQATMVEYDTTSTIVVGDITINTASSRKDVENNASSEGIKDDDKMQFAEMYFNRLTLTTDTTDDFGRPANTWRYRGSEVGTYAKTADASYTDDVTLGTIYSDLGMSDSDDRAEVYVDGIEAVDAAKVSRGNDLKVSEVRYTSSPAADCDVGKGTLIEAFLDEDTNDVTIVAINIYVAEINRVVAATSSKDAYVTLYAYTGPASLTDEFETEGFEDDQIVLYTYSNKEDEIESIVAAESVEGTLNRKVATKSFTLGDTAYDFGNFYYVDGGENNLGIGSEYIAYLDTNGYVVYVEESEYNIADYAFLRGLQGSGTVFQSDKAAVLTYDASKSTLDTDKDYTSSEYFGSYGTKNPGDSGAEIVVARQTSSGDYRLRDLNTVNVKVAANASTDFEMRNGRASINNGTGTLYADSRTVVVVGTYDSGASTPETVADAKYTAYTGANGMPDIYRNTEADTSAEAISTSYYCRSGNVVTIMFITVDTHYYNVLGGNNEVIYLALESVGGYVEDADNDYYELNGVVGGEIVTDIKVDVDTYNALYTARYTSGVFTGAFTNATYDDGVIIDLDKIGDANTSGNSYTVTGLNKLSNENLQMGYSGGTYGTAGTYVVANDVAVYFIDDDGDITAGTINQVRRSADDIVTYVVDSDGQISHLFIQQYFENNDQNAPGTGNTLTSITGVGYTDPNLTFTLNGTNAGQNYTVTLSMIVAGVTTQLGTYTVTGDATSTTRTIAVGSLASIATSGGMYMITCGGQNGTFVA